MRPRDFFELDRLGTSWRTETVAGATTFLTMAYIIVVNPAILSAAGIPQGPSMVATVLSAFFGTMMMGIYAKRPFAIAPYMGENAFIAYTVTGVLGYSWQTALGAIFIGGVLFTFLTLVGARSWLAGSIPSGLKIAFAVGIGLFLCFIGLNDTGLVVPGSPGAPVSFGDLGDTQVLLSVGGLFIMTMLLAARVKGALLIGIAVTAAAAFITGSAPVPGSLVSMPPSISGIFMKFNLAGALSWGFISVLLTVFVMDFVDTMGTLLGLSYRAGLLDEKGNLPDMEKPMLCDALATVAGAILGTTTTGAYIESASGIEEGGRSGFTAVVTAFLFLLALFFTPVLTSVPPCAYGPVLIVVGMLMLKPIVDLKFDDMTELAPAFLTMVLMSFTYNLGIGMTAGLLTWPLFKVAAGRWREVPAGLWVLSLLSLLYYAFGA
ncbi:MAG: NCS2 family permease [Candidatus Fermentibacteraceae bacterium]|nr:NCS2 family permease [Candidatus Fermentibacteraceae bacterium]MBN2607476.1 NCS2 family permease [Candidatus Fermentibacteraceae bacterium]